MRISEVRKTVGRYYGIERDEMLGIRKNIRVARPRQVAMYFSRIFTNKSLPAIGQHFLRDHTTVLYAVKRIEELSQEDMELRNDLLRLHGVLTQFQAILGECGTTLEEQSP